MSQGNKGLIKDYYGALISEGMYVNEINMKRQGWITEVSNKDGIGKVKIKVVRQDGRFLNNKSSYITDFEPSTNWCRALIDG